ncbi:MAG: hypothetical protein LBL79_04400 [Prevotella sp.]|nr:hypothetical protein [Prevotella sp.]
MKGLYFVMLLVVCSFTISCNIDDSVYTPNDEQTVKKEKLYGIKKVARPLNKAVAVNDKMWEINKD